MRTRLKKWGNSLGLRIPMSVAADAGLEAGTEVDLTLCGRELRVRPIRERRLSLAALLRKVTLANRHAVIATGARVGREV